MPYTVTFTFEQMNEIEMALMNYRHFLNDRAYAAEQNKDFAGRDYFMQRRDAVIGAEAICEAQRSYKE